MTTLKLKVVHRVLLQGLLNTEGTKSQRSLSDLNQILKIFDKIAFTDEERKALNLREEEGALKWNQKAEGKDDGAEVDVEKDFELSDDQKKLVYDIVKKKDEAKEFTIQNLNPMLELAAQVGYIL